MDMSEAEPFSKSARLNSWDGGWRTIAYRVEHRTAWWRRRQWVVLMDYIGGMFSDRDVVTSKHLTMLEANAACEATWAVLLADHDRITAHEEANATP